MKKTHILVMAMFAVFAFSAVAATAAMAESEWLVEGAAVTETLASETEGLLELVVFKSATSTEPLVTIDCSGLFDGTIGPAGVDSVTKILNTSDEEIILGTRGLSCTVTQSAGELGDCTLNSLATVFPNGNLPWATKIELLSGFFEDDFASTAGYEAECETSIGKLTNNCEGALQFARLTNETGTSPAAVLGTFQTLAAGSRANCSLTGEHTSEARGDGNTWATSGVSLTGRLATAVS